MVRCCEAEAIIDILELLGGITFSANVKKNTPLEKGSTWLFFQVVSKNGLIPKVQKNCIS
jgi:hypothetical protein